MVKILNTVRTIGALAAAAALHLPLHAGTPAGGYGITLLAPPAGDSMYSWNSKYGPSGYSEGDMTLGVSLQMNAPYGNDYTQGIIEIPIGKLHGGSVISAELRVETTGFGTGYYYGSAGLTWLDVGASALSGNVVGDGLGAKVGPPAIYWTLWNSGTPGDTGAPALKSFDVTSAVQADLAAGRSFSTFVMSGSRDTYGGIYAAESGRGARLAVKSTAPVPEPATWWSMAVGLGVLGGVVTRRTRS